MTRLDDYIARRRKNRLICIVTKLYVESRKFDMRPYPVSFDDLHTQFQSQDIMDLRQYGLVTLDSDLSGHPGASLTNKALSMPLHDLVTYIRENI